MLSLGYSNDGLRGIHDVYTKESFYNFEMHRHLFNRDFYLYDYFNEIWDRAVKNDNGCGYHMTDKDFYVFFLAHFYKHFKTMGGCGLRFFVDLYVIQHKISVFNDVETVELLKKINLYNFEKEVTNISESLFGDGNIEIDGATLKYIIDSGAYGTANHEIGDRMKRDGKIVAGFKMAFPSLKEMQVRYKILNKAPILLPIFYVVRWFSILFTGRKRAKLKLAIKKFFKREKNS